MKIKIAEKSYEEVIALPSEPHILPKKTNLFFRTLLKAVSQPDLKATNFHCERVGMDRLGKKEPCLFLMNHSCFIDLKIVSSVLYPRPFQIVCTSDGFVGKRRLMRNLGCIPTKKFVTDLRLVKDMIYALHTLKTSVLMYPEASYSFDGTATPLPDSLGKLLKTLNVPVVMIRTYGAFARNPLYNNLRLRKVDVSARMEYLLSPEDIKGKSVDALNRILKEQFTFDNFMWQRENKISVREPFRAEGLNRVLYRCASCQTEGDMEGKEDSLTCRHCGKSYTLTEYGVLQAKEGQTEFDHIPDWYRWERECVKKELFENRYRMEAAVDIYMMVNTKCIYKVGSGTLTHSSAGFSLVGCDGKLNYKQSPLSSYGLYSDYYWYEIGDMICIGDTKALYYCFPKDGKDIVAKTRLAAEELYLLKKRTATV